MGINRNIVECKESVGSVAAAVVRVLIETLWNVKKISQSTYSMHHRVLIETLWNVKVFQYRIICERIPVLIETLWNVKVCL